MVVEVELEEEVEVEVVLVEVVEVDVEVVEVDVDVVEVEELVELLGDVEADGLILLEGEVEDEIEEDGD